MNNYDFIGIGDIVVDTFIHISDAEASCDLDQEHCKLTLRFGDKVPYDFYENIYAVGNSPNASVSAARLGLKSALSAAIGDDLSGKDCLKSLEENKVSAEFIETDSKYPTNQHFVLWYEPERTILIKHANFERHFPKNVSTKWIYLSSIGEFKALEFHQEVSAWLKEHPETKLAFQPGTYQMKMGTEVLKEIYQRTEIFFCNFEESQRILATTEKDIKKLLQGIKDLGPKIVVITDGIKGAYAREDHFMSRTWNDITGSITLGTDKLNVSYQFRRSSKRTSHARKNKRISRSSSTRIQSNSNLSLVLYRLNTPLSNL